MAQIVPFSPSARRKHFRQAKPGRNISLRRLLSLVPRYAGFVVLPFLLAAMLALTVERYPVVPAALGDRVYVYDGDTIHVNDERIRILGLDTPEYGKLSRCREEALAASIAKEALQNLVLRGEIEIERRGLDRYGRTLAYVRIDGVNVADALIAQGLAREYHGGPRKGWCG
ncbi:MAG: thermonuclease family protein [Parvibaculum sp.]|nr:thermonuclease family protein [Parvibaculum sp.]